MVERCAVYCRLSYAPDGSLEAVSRQEETCRQLAARLGWPVAEVYADNNISAWKRGVNRPAWKRMLADLESGERDAIITYHSDRLIRSDTDLRDLLILADDRQLDLASVSGTRDLSNPDHRMILRIETAMAIKESDNISRRVKAAVESNAAKGRPQPGRIRGYGYERDCMTIVPAEAAVIEDMAGRVLAGQSVRSVAAWLNATSVPTVTGAAWIPATVRSILTHPRIAGLRALKGEIKGEAAWPAILDRATWADVSELITPVSRNRKRRPRGEAPARAHLLTGIARCATCGAGLRSMRRGDNKARRSYCCDNPRCPLKVARSQEHLDAYITGWMVGLLNDPSVLAAIAAGGASPARGREITVLEHRMARDKAKLAALAESGDPDYDPALAMQAIGSYQRKIDALRAQAAGAAQRRMLSRHAAISRDHWDALPLETRRALIKTALRITVRPTRHRGPGFDEESVSVELRDE